MNHRTAPVEMREKLACRADETPEMLRRLSCLEHVKEVLLISTCNRVEIYAASDKPEHAARSVKKFLALEKSISDEEMARHIFTYSRSEAVKHLYRVGAGLDSMVLGEPQILGQVKDAYRIAADAGATGVILNKLFHRAFQAAKRIRTETRIGNYAVSVAATAVELAAKIFKDLTKCTVLLVGAGNMGELAAQHLVGAGVAGIVVVNRTLATAEQLAQRFGGRARPFDELGDALSESDIVIATTGAPHPIITHKMVHDAIKVRRHKPIFLIDIAVPRDVEPKAQKIEDVYLYDIDDLQQITDSHKQERKREAETAESIVDVEVSKFDAWLATLEVVPTIIGLRRKFEEVAEEEARKAVDSLPNAGELEKKAIELLAHNVVNKLLHEPMTMLKRCAEDGRSEVSQACRVLFRLPAAPETAEADNIIEEEVDE